MAKTFGAVSRGIKAPIIRKGDDLAVIAADTLMEAVTAENITLSDRDILGITEAVVARAQGNYATVDDIASDIRGKFGGGHIGLVHPILSRNRFAVCLKGIAKGASKITLVLSYPSDEVGNHLLPLDTLDAKGINPFTDVIPLQKYRELFGYGKHTFTGIDYISYYAELIEGEGCETEIVFANNVKTVLDYTGNVLCCDIHSRQRSKRILKDAGAVAVFGLDDILSAPVSESGFNADYGLLGSNKATEDTIKLFPRNCKAFVNRVQELLSERCGKKIEVLVYGDGAFKDPVGKIWELADPVVSPGFTDGLIGMPNELKLKYLADNDYAHLSGDALRAAISESIAHKDSNLSGKMASEGTTPRQLTDLIGSLCDLTSGSGDKGTPFVLIQNYFDNYTD